MWYLLIFLCASASWFLACLFTAQTPKDAASNGLVAGVLSAVPAVLLSLAAVDLDVTPVIFLPLSLLLPIQQKRAGVERGMALLSALGAYGLLALIGRLSFALLSPLGGLALVLLAVAVAGAAGSLLRSQFPPDDWQEYFKNSGKERVTVRVWHLWLALGLAAALELSLYYASGEPESAASAVIFAAAGAALYWGALYAVSLMVAYRREKLTALIDQNYRNEMQSFMSVIRSQRHDYNFHVQTLAGLMEQGNVDECRRYLRNLMRDSAEMNTILPVKDPAIAALIFSFRTMALENGTELHLDIQNDLSCVVTSVYETNKIIGNLLQNAIDEVRTHEDKSFGIHLYILKRGENCIIHAANKMSVKEDAQKYLQDMYRPGCSTKAGHEGIGLSSIQNLLRRYRGVVYSRVDGDIIHCVAKIPLRLEGGEAL